MRPTALHSVNEGAASQSYGLQVAALAGVSQSVIRSAKKQLRVLEQNSAALSPQGDLFDHKAVETEEPEEHPLLATLRAMQPDDLSPKEALERLYQLKQLVYRKIVSPAGRGAGRKLTRHEHKQSNRDR